MHARYFLSAALSLMSSPLAGVAGKPTPTSADGMRKYTRPHSLGNYTFEPRDGWHTANVTSLQYKHQGEKQNASLKHHAGVGAAIQGALTDVWNGLRGIGLFQDVTITWYTGHDLLGPSCWPNSKWAPTDESFACALTLKGWTDRPKCFEFLELCSHKDKCIFVRVIDTCAGCAQGSKHVDLTKAAFKALADLEVGVTTVKMRRATHPNEWYLHLWGPRQT